ncbi:GAF domain-containing protein [Variovorax soli]|uniref:GAF domain-containing protein n=1 Tax=Variovorax soli TaxID=376815 RepID=A0ABU1ND18_9BURK|nr:GAF domain-containing protein [Variovorax soli]MDR6536182.1 hypothetical protein [Variovorax soli]
MPAATASTLTALVANFLDVLAEAPSADAALRQVDLVRRVIAGGGIFSIQQNVTTECDPADEIRLCRFYSSEGGRYPVNGTKRKTLTPWTECIFLRGRVFVGEGKEALARHFDDFEDMRIHGLQSVVNVPLLQGGLCYATFNVFGTRPQWLPHEILGIRLLALAAARWVPAAPGLAYRFTAASLTSPLEA